MKSNRGAVIVAVGDNAKYAAERCEASVRRVSGDQLRVTRLGAEDAPADSPYKSNPVLLSRWLKTHLLELTSYDQTLYLDADTLMMAWPKTAWLALDAGWDLALSYSTRQGVNVLGHLTSKDRAATFDVWSSADIIGLQPGVIFVRRSAATVAFWREWAKRWQESPGLDAGAFHRALWARPLHVWALGRDYNGLTGAYVKHKFGQAVSR